MGIFARSIVALVISAVSLDARGLGSPRPQTPSGVSCEISGKFRAIVEAKLGASLAKSSAGFELQLYDSNSGALLCRDGNNPGMVIYPASTIKTLVALTVFHLIDESKLRLSDRITINQSNAQEECPDWGCDRYGPGRIRTVEELLVDMLTVSNNLATNQLIDVAGKPTINAAADAIGAPELRVHRKVYSRKNPEPDITLRNAATARGLARLYEEISMGRAVAYLRQESRLALIEILRGQRHNDRLNANFPASVKFFHKPGNTSQVTGDAGFYTLQNGNVTVVLAGLQNFASFRNSAGDTVSGYTSLAQIGKATLDLTKSLAP